MDRNDPTPRYTRAELVEVAQAAVREGVEDAEPERVERLANRALTEFDERRGAAAGYSAEQLSGTRRDPVVGRVGEGEEFPAADG